MKYNLKPICCPLCSLSNIEKLIPSRKIDEERGYWQEHKDIWISLCLNCGMVFENPQVTVLETRDYNEHHYYNDWFNQVAVHDKLQNT